MKSNTHSISADSSTDEILSSYYSFRRRKIVGLILYVLVLIIAAGIGMGIGSYEISFARVYEVILLHLTDLGGEYTSLDMKVVWLDRLPRLLCAVAIGIGLGGAGAAMQSMMKNPLADPYTTGISSGAGFGAVLAICTGFMLIPGTYGIVINAFIFALVPVDIQESDHDDDHPGGYRSDVYLQCHAVVSDGHLG